MRGRTILAAAAWGVLSGLAGTPAGADLLGSTFGAPLVETLHTVDIELADGAAIYTVRRALHNDGDDREEAQLTVDLPPGGALTGLRLKTGGAWIDARLLPADQARERYFELTQPGEAKPRVVALLSWGERSQGSLEIFPVGAGKTVIVEYTVTAPIRARDGRVWLAVPRSEGDGLVRPEVHVDGVADLRKMSWGEVPTFDVDDDPAGDVMSAVWYSASLAEFAPPMAEVRARYATLRLNSGRTVWRLELDAATEWGTKPVGARVVFVLDASHSEGRPGIDAQLALVRGYLTHLPDAQVEIVLFRRHASRLFGDFVAAPEVDAALDELPRTALAPGNGSNVELGLSLAAGSLAGWEGPARIVVMTDELFRNAYDPDAAVKALAAAPGETIVHGVVRSATGGSLVEAWAQEAAFMPVARASGGTVVSITGDDPDLGELARVMRGLVVPVRLDGFGVYTPDVAVALDEDVDADEEGQGPVLFGEDDGEIWPRALGEGVGVRRMQIAPAAKPEPEKLVLRGWLWGKEWTREVRVSASLAGRLPALVFGHPLEEGLEEAEGRPLATAAGAVSRWTSYLAEEKKAAPSTAGYDVGCLGVGGTGHGSFSCGTRCGISCGGATDVSRFIAILRARVEPGIAECARRAGRPTLTVSVRVETTFREIVDAGATGGDLSPPLQSCVEDAVWAAQLDGRFRWSNRSFDFDVVIGDGDDAPAEPVEEEEWFL